MTNYTSTNSGQQPRQSERGNVLFLILIAVALFAALSYAVTQSTRSGGGDASSETSLVNSSQITQYPASIKTSITRMNVSNSISPDQLIFDPPSNFSALSGTQQTQAVFYPSPTGGGATYQQAPANVMATPALGTWIFNAENEVINIGTDADATGLSNDIIAFLPGISQTICNRINSQLGISGTILETQVIDTATLMDSTNTGIPGASGPKLGTGATALVGQAQGCFSIGAGPTYVYYSVLVER